MSERLSDFEVRKQDVFRCQQDALAEANEALGTLDLLNSGEARLQYAQILATLGVSYALVGIMEVLKKK